MFVHLIFYEKTDTLLENAYLTVFYVKVKFEPYIMGMHILFSEFF